MRKILSEIQEEDIYDETSTRIIMLFKLNNGKELGIRETQRILGIKSPSTVSGYFLRLLEDGLLSKTDKSKYKLTSKGSNYNNLVFPIKIKIDSIFGKYINKNIFLILITLFCLLFEIIILLTINTHMRLFFHSLLILFTFGILIFFVNDWIAVKRKLQDFLQIDDN